MVSTDRYSLTKDKAECQETSGGVEELTVSGYIEAREGESSPKPPGASSFKGAGSRSSPKPREGQGEDCRGGGDGYLELYTNVSSWLEATCDKNGVGWFVSGGCENGHRFAKTLVCQKEWCPICGAEGSIAHNRRWLRWLPKIQQFGTMGYFVFTMPEALRSKYRRKKALSGLGHQVQELLKAFGYSRGLRRWHYFGDKSEKYHPHLNCLVDGGYLSPQKLDAIKRGYAELLGVEIADVNYHYRKSQGKMLHSLRYICRSTFRDYTWDLKLALELKGFRNMVVWGRGRWDNDPSWSLDELKGKAEGQVEGLQIEAIESLAEKRCPVCGMPITWGKALPVWLLYAEERQDLGAGYYRLTNNKAPPARGRYRPKYPLLGYLANIKHCRLAVAEKRAEAEARAEAEENQGWWVDLLGGDAYE